LRVDLSRMTAAAIEAALDDGSHKRRPRLSGMRAVAAGAALAVAARAAVKHGPTLPRMPDISSLPELVRERLADHGWLPDDEDERDEQYDQDGYDDDPDAEGDEDFDDDEDGDEDEDDDHGDEDDDGDGPQAEVEEQDDEIEDEDEDLDDEPEATADEEDESDEEDEIEEEPEGEGDGDDEEPDEDDDAADQETDEARNGRRTTAKARRNAPRLEVPSDGADAGSEVPGVLELLSARRSRPPVMSRRRRANRVDPASRPPEPPERESDETKTGSRK
jgi:hypothetical protein